MTFSEIDRGGATFGFLTTVNGQSQPRVGRLKNAFVRHSVRRLDCNKRWDLNGSWKKAQIKSRLIAYSTPCVVTRQTYKFEDYVPILSVQIYGDITLITS